MAATKKVDWSLYVWWILGALLGVGLGIGVMFVLIMGIVQVGGTVVINGESRITEDFVATYAFIPSLGLALGLAQYVVLRRYLPRMGSWIPATLAAFLLLAAARAILAALLPRLGVPDTALPAAMYVLAGLTVGGAQWLLLRQRVAGAGWWILANVAGWALIYPLVGNSWNNLVEVFVLGVLPAVVTAMVLGRLITRRAPPAGSGGVAW